MGSILSVQNRLHKRLKRVSRKFLEPSHKPKVIHTGNSLEFGKSCEDPSWNHRISTPHRSETSSIAERAVRRVKEGTSAVLLQSGLDEKWWADSMKWYTNLRNIQDFVAEGKTPYERRCGETFKGPKSSFWNNGWMSPDFNTRSIKPSSTLQDSFTNNLSCVSMHRGENFERRHCDWMHQKFILGEALRKRYWYHKREKNSNSQ